MPGVEEQEQRALASGKAVESVVAANTQPLQLAPVEYLGDGSSSSQQLGQIDLNQFNSYRSISLFAMPTIANPRKQRRSCLKSIEQLAAAVIAQEVSNALAEPAPSQLLLMQSGALSRSVPAA